MSATCDYGTQGCQPMPYRVSYDTTWGWTVWPQASSDTSTTQSLAPLSSSTARVSRTGPSRSRASQDVDLELPKFKRPPRPVAPRMRVRYPAPVLLVPKTAARSTQVAWTRGRPPRGLSFRTLRLLGTGLRR